MRKEGNQEDMQSATKGRREGGEGGRRGGKTEVGKGGRQEIAKGRLKQEKRLD